MTWSVRNDVLFKISLSFGQQNAIYFMIRQMIFDRTILHAYQLLHETEHERVFKDLAFLLFELFWRAIVLYMISYSSPPALIQENIFSWHPDDICANIADYRDSVYWNTRFVVHGWQICSEDCWKPYSPQGGRRRGQPHWRYQAQARSTWPATRCSLVCPFKEIHVFFILQQQHTTSSRMHAPTNISSVIQLPVSSVSVFFIDDWLLYHKETSNQLNFMKCLSMKHKTLNIFMRFHFKYHG